MAEKADEKDKGGKLSGWIKAAITTVLGLVSGAGLMYLSPLLDKVIKPGKPVANFQYAIDGSQVTFHNRSTGGTEGWWDFGDGSALEPFVPGQDSVTHPYRKPGVYTVKLSLRNFLGEENERSATVNVEGGSASPPAIDALEVVPIRPELFAPATFRVVSRVKNADLCVWALGNDRPLEITPENASTQERFVTFTQPGNHVIKLAAFNGKQTIEKSAAINVLPAPAGTAMAVLRVTDEAVQVETKQVRQALPIEFPPGHKESSYKFSQPLTAEPGFVILKAAFADPIKDAPVKGLEFKFEPDRRKVRLTGELFKTGESAKRNGPPPRWVAPVVLTLERRGKPTMRTAEPIAAALTVPGTTLLPMPTLPPGWVAEQRKLTLEVREGNQVVWQEGRMPQQVPMRLRDRTYRVTATQTGNQVRIDVVDMAQQTGRQVP
jgi:PKD repeat protein